MQKLIPFLLLGSLAQVTMSSAQATSYPFTFTDDLGRKVTLASEPRRIVSMLPSDTETVCALGACDRLVGVDKYSDFPAEVMKLPKVGDLFTPGVEAIVAQKPDLVLVSKYGQVVAPLTAAGVTVVAVNPETFEDVFTKTTLLGKILNREAQAKALVTGMRRGIARTEILTRGAAKKPSTYYEIDPTPYTVGPNSFIGVLLSKAGAANIIPASLGDFPKISPEVVVRGNPQLILGLDPATAKARPGWAGLSAVKAGRVFKLPSELETMLGRPGPRLPQALAGLAKLIHPELFR